MRHHGAAVLTALLTVLVPGAQLLTAQSAVAAISSTTKTLKPDVFSAGAPRVGGRSSGPAAGAPSAGLGKEVVADRSRNSRTFVRGANFETLIYPASINYRDAKGKWQPIDNTLVPSTTGGVQNRANSYTVAFPKSLDDGSIHLAGQVGFVDFSLEKARGSLAAAGNKATYADALKGVTVVYSANADSLSELLRLEDKNARNSYTFRIRTSTGLTAKQLPSGAIVVVDASQKAQYAFAAPYMFDSAGVSGEVQMKLDADSGHGDGQTITVTADKEWLKSKTRKFPVVIDPAIGTNLNFFGGYDCFVQNTNPNTNLCSSAAYLGTADQVGNDGSSVSHTLLSFPVQTGYPDDRIVNSNILDAELDLTLASSSSAGAVAVTASPITQFWNDNYTTWNSRDNATAWSAPGGTFGPAVDTENIGPAAGSYRFINLTQTIQNWVSGNATNYGFLLKASNEGAAGLLRFDNQAFNPANSTDPNLPHLRIQWNNFNGLEPWYKYEAHKLSDRMSLAVNVANGNLVVQATDLAINGTGLNLHVNRYYNSLADASGWHIGNGWNVNVGCDVRLDVDDFDGLTFHGPDGYAVLFRSNGTTWITPPGLDATLVKNADSTYTLTWHKNGEKFNFQTGGCLQSMVDQNGNTITMSYNGSVQSITDTQNRLTNFTYGTPVNSDYITQISDPAGRTTNYSYNATGDLTSFGDANGKNTQYAYNANDQLSQIIDPNGNTVNFTYGTSYPYQLTQIGYLNSSCAGGSCNTTFAYSSVPGACDALVNGDAVTVNTVVTDANGHQTTHCLDNQGHAIQVIDAKGQKAAISYSSNNNVLTFSDGANPKDPTAFAYDPTTNNLTNATQPTGANQIWGYKDCTNDPQNCNTAPQYYPDTFQDSQGNKYVYGYTSSNLTSVKNNSNGSTWNATHNSNGTVAMNKDANGNVTSYTYDSVGNLTQITYPAPLGAVTMTYDGLSRMVTRRDGKGQLTTYGYDTLDRVTQITYSDNSTIVYTYDNDGNTTQLQDNTGLSTFSYDTMNRPTRKVLPGATTMTYAYDGSGNLTSLQDPGGTVTYGYDAVNELTSLQEPNGSTTSFGYNAGYRRTSTTYPNGVGEGMTYDTSERLTQIKATRGASTLNSFTYCYNVLNPCSPNKAADTDLRWSVTDVNNAKTSYNYTALNQLTSASNPSGTYAFSYDPNGNRCRDDASGCANPTYAYNAANELTSHAGTTYSYDANGNETGNSAGLSLSYNPKDQTTAIGGLSMTYTGATQTERVTAGSTNFTYSVLGCGGASTGVASNTAYTRDNKGQLVEERLPGTPNYVPYYYLFDGLGSVVGLTDSAGTVKNTYTYGPYGEKGTWSEPIFNPWLFAGGYFDASTGLYKFGMRYYDPSVGRWTQQDSQPGPNLYAYVGDNPTNQIDPSGATSAGLCGFAAGVSILGVGLGGLTAGALVWALGQSLGATTAIGLLEIGAGLASLTVAGGILFGALFGAGLLIGALCFGV